MTLLPLEEHHRAHLQGSAISEDVITARGYVSINPGSIHDWRQLAPRTHSDSLLKKVLHGGALAFPLYRCGEPDPYTWVLRPEQPRTKDGKPIKYEYPRNTPNVFDVLPAYRAALADPSVPLWLTEGAKKADSLASAYGDQIVPVNENGVWGWRSRGKTLDDFNRIVWEGRRVVLAPDGDVRHNKGVRQAVDRAARVLLAKGASEVLICLLPAPPDMPTMGVDDYLAQGHTCADLESHLVELGSIEPNTQVALCKHPVTGERLFLPPGYDVQGKTIVRRFGDSSSLFYSGMILVTQTGRDLYSGEETATVIWNGKGAHHQIDIARADMASAAGCTKILGGAGAAIHAGNAKGISTYLVEFIQQNYDALPRTNYTARLGAVGDGLVLPAGQVGLANECAYTGPHISVGTDASAYPRILRMIAGWDSLATLWAVFGLSLASPALARLKPERNPIVYLAGSSGSGKTTVTHFAVGAYGDPSKNPLQIQCGSGSTTRVGIQQTLTALNGVPIFLDDAHMLWLRKPDVVEGTIYDFGNAQLRTFGGLGGKVQGGQTLGGLMLLAGEMLPEFAHGGSQRRTLVIDCGRRLPVGRPPRTTEGEQRARLIRSAWQEGAGLFGLAVNARIWGDWGRFMADMEALERDSALRDVQAWRRLLAAAAVALGVAFQEAGVALDHVALMREWARLYNETQTTHDPAIDALDRVLVMLAQCELSNDAPDEQTRSKWEYLTYDRKMVAARKSGESCWRVLTTSPQWRQMVGPGIVDQFGAAWIDAGYIQPFSESRASARCYTGRGYFQCVLIPDVHFLEQRS
jgi:hypothetical protein